MSQPVDVAKLVGAASAPVALIIATSIFLSNLTARYTAMATTARQLTSEFREKEEHDERAESLRIQLGLYRRRLALIIKATFWLMLAILSFIGTVLFTSLSVVLPNNPAWPIITGSMMLAGLLILVYCVAVEGWENHLAKGALSTEMSEFPEVQRNEGGSPGQAILNEARP
jgi:hypothetical protein